ncbi:MAG: SARP family transcriptional regulator, partial [Anaerolineae bacterium]|nr:SARP family transcriptional regulator [Anaerolineae bacterium]
MTRLSLTLLGGFQATLDGEPVTGFESDKVRALLAYLVLEVDRPHRRDTLAEMLWPDRPQGVARNNLRQALANLRKAIGDREADPPFLRISRAELQFNPDSAHRLDVDHFRQRLATCETHGHLPTQVCGVCLPPLTEAVALYRDDFMAGFTLPDSPSFDEWQFFQTEGLRDELASVLERLVRWHGSRREYEPAIAHARRWLELDPLQESAHRHLMELYARADQRTVALRQYRL